MKNLLFIIFLSLFHTVCYSQTGLNENGKEISDQATMINRYGAKGSGTGITKYGQSFLATPVLATLTTTEVSSILSSKASGGGNITNGGGVVTSRGVVWSISSTPTTALTTKTSNGTGAGTFTSNLKGLLPSTLYYVRSYAINSVGTAYGNQVSFTTSGPPPVQVGGSALCDGEHTTVVVEVTGQSGKKWMDRNLGASRVASSNTDFQAYGCLFQWGRGNDGHASVTWYNGESMGGLAVNGSTTTKSSTDDPDHALFIRYAGEEDWRSTPNDNLWQGVNGINNPCPSGFRVPTIAELTADISTFNDANVVLKLVYSGTHESDAGGTTDYIYKQGSSNFMTLSSSTVNGTSAYNRTASHFYQPGIATESDGRGAARAVRCIKN